MVVFGGYDSSFRTGDVDLAAIYEYTTGAFIQQVERNQERFPKDLMFRLDAGTLARNDCIFF